MYTFVPSVMKDSKTYWYSSGIKQGKKELPKMCLKYVTVCLLTSSTAAGVIICFDRFVSLPFAFSLPRCR